VVVAYDRNTFSNMLLRKPGVEVITTAGAERAVAAAAIACAARWSGSPSTFEVTAPAGFRPAVKDGSSVEQGQ
jgi:hypothetical protein